MSENLPTSGELSLTATHKKFLFVQREGELIQEATVKDFLTVRQDGRRQIQRKMEYCSEVARATSWY